jgi:cell division transport system ATP-binding protein
MTVYDNVAFALRVIGMSEKKITKRVRYVLKLVDLSDKHESLPHQLSQGERQRVAIARALVNNPHVIIADEPTGNLDPVLSSDIMSLFDKINSLGATVVVVTHDLELVHQFDHRVVTIENGKIISDIPAKYSVETAPHRPEPVKAAPAVETVEEETVSEEPEESDDYAEAETEKTVTEEVAENE